MKNLIKTLYILLLFGLPIQSSDDKTTLDSKEFKRIQSENSFEDNVNDINYKKNPEGYTMKLTPEQIAYCRAIKAQVLAETGDKQQAKKAYKSAWGKFYQSSPEFKKYKKSYALDYQKSRKNKRVEQANQEKFLSKKIKSGKKQKTIILQQNNTPLTKASVPVVLDDLLIDTLPMNNDLDSYDFDDFFDGYKFLAGDEDHIDAINNEHDDLFEVANI